MNHHTRWTGLQKLILMINNIDLDFFMIIILMINVSWPVDGHCTGVIFFDNKHLIFMFSCQELRKPSYAEICQRVKDAPTLQQPPTPKEAKPACAAPAGEERKCPDSSIPTGEAKARETYPPSSKPGSATSGRPPRDARRPAGRWASPPPHPGKTPSKDPQHTPPKSPQ